MQSRLLTVDEVAQRLGRTPAAVRWQMYKGALPFGKVAGRRVMREQDLEAYIDAAFEGGGAA
jgi:hypothetical protein